MFADMALSETGDHQEEAESDNDVHTHGTVLISGSVSLH
jgi:hypothetical protein